MADNNNDDDLHRHMEAQEQTFRAQQEALNNIKQMLAQFLINWNNNDTDSNHGDKKDNNNNKDNEQPLPPPTSNGASSIDDDVIKGILAQIASLAQRVELKKVGITRCHLLE